MVSGTRDAIMMVEAGVKILPEDVMADAILFAQQALQPLVEIQEKLRELVGRPKRVPYLDPQVDSVLKLTADLADGRRRVRRRRRRDHRHRSRDGRLVEVAAVCVKGGKVVDTFSTLVNPGRPIVGNQMHGIKDADVKGKPSRAEAARKIVEFVGDAPFAATAVGFDIAFIEEASGRHPHRAGQVPRHVRNRPRDYRTSRTTSSARSPRTSASSSRRATAHCRTPRPQRTC